MPTKTRTTDAANRLALRILEQLGRMLREARIAADLSQAALGAAVGVSRGTVARIESGTYTGTTVVIVARMLRELGLELRVTAYPVSSPLRDVGHLKLIGRILDHIQAPLSYRTDVPLPNPGDMRAWDLLLTRDRRRVAIEAETRLHDLQELVRRMHAKRRDGMVDGLVLALADSRTNRQLVVELLRLLPEYPRLSRTRFFHCLESGDLPPDGIVLV